MFMEFFFPIQHTYTYTFIIIINVFFCLYTYTEFFKVNYVFFQFLSLLPKIYLSVLRKKSHLYPMNCVRDLCILLVCDGSGHLIFFLVFCIRFGVAARLKEACIIIFFLVKFYTLSFSLCFIWYFIQFRFR